MRKEIELLFEGFDQGFEAVELFFECSVEFLAFVLCSSELPGLLVKFGLQAQPLESGAAQLFGQFLCFSGCEMLGAVAGL